MTCSAMIFARFDCHGPLYELARLFGKLKKKKLELVYWPFRETKDGKEVLLTGKGFDYWMTKINADVFDSNGYSQDVHKDHHHTCMQKNSLMELAISRVNTISHIFQEYLDGKGNGNGHLLLRVTISDQYHWSFHRLQ